MPKRNIVLIDQAKCNGCGLCVPSCAEGAIQIVDGKARLVKEQYCDGLGACLGECPQDAISIEEREADAFNEAAVADHLDRMGQSVPQAHHVQEAPRKPAHAHGGSGCPGAAAMSLGACPGSAARSMPAAVPQAATGEDQRSMLRNWPVQLKLLPVMAPYLEGADLCIAADCTAFAFADFHKRMLAGKVLVIGCPKLDDVQAYIGKLTAIFQQNHIRSVEVVHMEVPCCSALVHLVRESLQASDADIPLTLTKVGIEGQILETSRQ